jgi:hypothetical protein
MDWPVALFGWVRDQVYPTWMPRVAAAQPFDCQRCTAQAAVQLNRFKRVVGAAGVKATVLPNKRAERELIQPDERFQGLTHGLPSLVDGSVTGLARRSRRCHCLSKALRKVALSRSAMPRRAINTTSIATGPCASTRNFSLTKRLMRLR